MCVHSRLYAPSMRWIQIPFALWESLVQRITYKCVKIGVIMSAALENTAKEHVLGDSPAEMYTHFALDITRLASDKFMHSTQDLICEPRVSKILILG